LHYDENGINSVSGRLEKVNGISKLVDLKVKLFTNGADKAQIVAMAKQPWIAVFTTNPSLLKKAGVADYFTFWT
jgi:hypothetical protein